MKLSVIEQVCAFLEGPGSSVVEHLHGKQVVVGSIPILGKRNFINISGLKSLTED